MPGEGPTLEFVAVSNAPSNFTATLSNNKVSSFSYTVDTDATKQNDIVVATTLPIAGNNNASVPLDFQHIMAAVNVKIGTEMTAGTINSITFKNIKSTGTYNVSNGTWGNIGTPKDYTVTFKDDGVADNTGYYTDGENTEAVVINGDNATFMMIPQTLENIPATDESEAKEVQIIVNFTYEATDNTTDLTASLSDQKWEMGKTTNYMINISPDFTLSIEEDEQEPLTTADCHYDKRIVHIKNEHSNVKWTLSSDVNWVKFRIVPDNFRDDPDFQTFNDYWIETHTVRTIKKHITRSGTNVKEDILSDETIDYPISGTINGEGSATVIVYFHENTGTAPEGSTKRDANLILNTEKGTLQDITLPISQFYPLWASYNGGYIAYERIEEKDDTYPWGLATSLKIEYSSPDTKPSWANSGWGVIIWWVVDTFLPALEKYFREAGEQLRGELYKEFYDTYYNTDTNKSTQFITITSNDSSDPDGDGTIDWGKEWPWKVTLNYNNLNNITTNSTGLDNTLKIINYAAGSVTDSPAETWLSENSFTSSVIVDDTDYTDIEETAAYVTSRLKNPLNLNTQITITTATNDGEEEEPVTDVQTLPSIVDTYGIKWFLPANDEISTLKQTACDNDTENNDQALSGSYWTSTSGAGVDNSPSAFMYSADAISGTDVSRKSSTTHKIRAARVKP
ncbi:MAG: fimbrillin family protein [Bacteroides sp.]|nr:fimbrillin family protein [Bacteroides sp.]MBQ8602740.1 fimbrillin family protein [Bacteroides sp.]